MTLKQRALMFGILFLGMGLYWAFHKHANHVDTSLASLALPANDKERIIISPKLHTMAIVTHGPYGDVVTKQYFNPRGDTNVEETKEGVVRITARTWGTELGLRGGFAVAADIQLRGAVGLDLFYVHGFDFGPAALLASSISGCRAGAYVAYNIYDNVSVGAYLDNHSQAGFMASVRF